MSSTYGTAVRWLSEGVGAGRAVVVRSAGSSPFEVGSTLLVADDGRIAGSVSAGCVDGAAVDAVRAARRDGYRELVHYGVTDEQASEVGLSCGGSIDVLVEPDIAPEVLAAASAQRTTAVATPLPFGRETSSVGRVTLDAGGILSGSLSDPAVDVDLVALVGPLARNGASQTIQIAGCDYFVDVFPRERLVIVGAGDIAVHLTRLAHAFGLRTVVVDARTSFLTCDRFPDADELLLGWADELAERAGIDGDAHVVALAHDPKFDDPALLAALRCGARYVGALGSRRTQAARLSRLRQAGVCESDLLRIHGPIGLDLGAHKPSDIALGILAEIVAEENRTRRPRTP